VAPTTRSILASVRPVRRLASADCPADVFAKNYFYSAADEKFRLIIVYRNIVITIFSQSFSVFYFERRPWPTDYHDINNNII